MENIWPIMAELKSEITLLAVIHLFWTSDEEEGSIKLLAILRLINISPDVPSTSRREVSLNLTILGINYIYDDNYNQHLPVIRKIVSF